MNARMTKKKYPIKKGLIWDYKIPKNWQPKTETALLWYLERKINYGDWKGLEPAVVKKYYRKIRLDPGKKLMLQNYFTRYA